MTKRSTVTLVSVILCVTWILIATVPSAYASFPGSDGRIAFRTLDSTARHIYPLQPNGHGGRQLTRGPYSDLCAAYSPNGRDIALCGSSFGPGLTAHRSTRPAVRAASPAPGVVSIALPLDPGTQFPTTEYAAFGSVWVLTQGNIATLQRIDPRTNRVTGSVSLGYGDPSGDDGGAGSVASAAGSLWVPEYFRNTVLRIDPVRLTITHTIPVGRSPSGVATADGAVFVADSHASAVSRIDPAANRVVATIPVGDPRDFNGGPYQLAYTAGSMWANVPAQQLLVAINPITNRVVARHSVAPALACGRLDPAPGAIWLDDQNCSNTFARFDLTTGVVTRIQESPTVCLLGIAVLTGQLWADEMTFDPSTGCGPGSLVPRDLRTGAVLGAGIPIRVVGFEVAGLHGSLWTNDFSTGRTVLRVTPEGTS